MTRQRYTKFLCYHLQLQGLNCFPIDYPVVPRGFNRLRIVFHATNTEAEVEHLANSICEWAQEMLLLEESGKGGVRIPSAARQVNEAHAAAELGRAGGLAPVSGQGQGRAANYQLSIRPVAAGGIAVM
jgi:8-amino-7-oxononanoate synthase